MRIILFLFPVLLPFLALSAEPNSATTSNSAQVISPDQTNASKKISGKKSSAKTKANTNKTTSTTTVKSKPAASTTVETPSVEGVPRPLTEVTPDVTNPVTPGETTAEPSTTQLPPVQTPTTTDTTPAPISEPVEALEIKKSLISRTSKAGSVQINFAPLDMLLPQKIGISGAYHKPITGSLYEFEYLRGTVSVPFWLTDLGGMTEQRFSVLVRSFGNRNSFNWFWGVNYNRFDIDLGSSYLDQLGAAGVQSSYDIIDIQTLGLTVGLGNRWYFQDRFYFAVDWLTWSQPLNILKKEAPYLSAANDSDDKDLVDRAIRVVAYSPRFSVAKVSLGFSF